MRIPGVLLRTPVTLTAPGANEGDGPGPGVAVTVKGQVTRQVKVTNDTTGQTISVWATVRLRPTVRVAGRTPGVVDTLTVQGVTRGIASVEPVQGPGAAVAYLQITAGDG